jgi:hypothetical protein
VKGNSIKVRRIKMMICILGKSNNLTHQSSHLIMEAIMAKTAMPAIIQKTTFKN